MRLLLEVLSILMTLLTNGHSAIEWPVQNSIRLVNGNSKLEGRVEVFTGYEWGTVCDDEWGDIDAGIVCRELGYTSIRAKALGSATFGEGSGPVYFDNVGCNGTENKLGDCGRQRNCRHDEDAGVMCLEETYFLFGLTILRNNSIITLSKLHENNISNLACTTENAICCSETQYDFAIGWEFPNGSYVSTSNQNITGVYLSTRNKSMILQVTAEASYTTGIYQCTIPGLNNLSNHLYIGILRDSDGCLQIERLYYDQRDGKIVCLSIGGPVQRVMWKKDDQELFTVNQNYEFSQELLDRTNGTYKHILRFLYKGEDDSGTYTCDITNQLGDTAAIINITACAQDSIRLQRKDDQTMFQVCFEDEWYQAVTINEVVFRKNTNSVYLIDFRLFPSDESIKVQSDNNSINSSVIIKCSTKFQNLLFANKTDHTTVSVEHQGTLNISINGLLRDTPYQCCLTMMSSPFKGSTIPSITTQCTHVRTTSNSQDSESTTSIIIALGTLVGIFVFLLLTTIAICLVKRICCGQGLSRESFEGSIMRQNPLYESAEETTSKPVPVPDIHIYSDVYLLKRGEPENKHQYVDIGVVPRNKKTPSDTSEVANPLYSTGEFLVQ